jgi:hypothetical protein
MRKTLSQRDVLRIRVQSGVAEKTWARFVRGEKIQPGTMQRIADAANQLGIKLPKRPTTEQRSAP